MDSKTALSHYNKLLAWAEDVERERTALETYGSSVRMATLQLVQVEEEAKCISLSDQSMTKKLFLHSSVGVSCWGKETWTVYPQREPQQQFAQLLQEAIFPPSTQPFTNGSNRAIEHSLGTSTSPTSATKSILKQNSLQFPHYFTCQMHTKRSRKAKWSSGAPQHTSCQPQTTLKTLLFLYTKNLSHLLSQKTILSLKAQTGLSTLTRIT